MIRYRYDVDRTEVTMSTRLTYFPPELCYEYENERTFVMIHWPPLSAAFRSSRDEDGWHYTWLLPDFVRDEAFRMAECESHASVWQNHFDWGMIMAGKYEGEY